MELTREVAQKVLAIVDAGLVKGLGEPIAGKMCVEAAVCFALGLPHSDNPPCVGSVVRELKIRLNDSEWSSDAARTRGMRRLAIAQLGSNEVDQEAFAKIVSEEVIKQIVPIALRAAATVQKEKEHKTALEQAAKECEENGTKEAALNGKKVADAAFATNTNFATKYAADAAFAADADFATKYATKYAADAVYVVAVTIYTAAATAYATAAANSAAVNSAAEKSKLKDKLLSLVAEIAVTALSRLGCKGVEWLDICQERRLA